MYLDKQMNKILSFMLPLKLASKNVQNHKKKTTSHGVLLLYKSNDNGNISIAVAIETITYYNKKPKKK